MMQTATHERSEKRSKATSKPIWSARLGSRNGGTSKHNHNHKHIWCVSASISLIVLVLSLCADVPSLSLSDYDFNSGEVRARMLPLRSKKGNPKRVRDQATSKQIDQQVSLSGDGDPA